MWPSQTRHITSNTSSSQISALSTTILGHAQPSIIILQPTLIHYTQTSFDEDPNIYLCVNAWISGHVLSYTSDNWLLFREFTTRNEWLTPTSTNRATDIWGKKL